MVTFYGMDTPQKKLESLHKIRDVRFLEDVESTKRMQDVCDLIPQSVEGLDTAKTGWHRRCHQRFTKNLDRLKPAVELSYPTTPELGTCVFTLTPKACTKTFDREITLSFSA